jgi:hypothetical protein
MRPPRIPAAESLWTALFLLATFGSAAGCNADLESVCHAGPCQGGGGSATSSDGGAGAGGAGGATCPGDPQSGDIPCEVHAVLAAKCQNCHNADHLAGAPIDLLACDRFHELDCGLLEPRVQTARNYLASDFMPLGMEELTAAEKQILVDWLDACAPCVPAGMGCGDPPAVKACGE